MMPMDGGAYIIKPRFPLFNATHADYHHLKCVVVLRFCRCDTTGPTTEEEDITPWLDSSMAWHFLLCVSVQANGPGMSTLDKRRETPNQYLVSPHNDGNKLFIKTFHGRIPNNSGDVHHEAVVVSGCDFPGNSVLSLVGLCATSRVFYEQRAAKKSSTET